jgi:hypothetical protein
MSLDTPVSPGEFLDKLTILEIKAERIESATKLTNIRHELALLRTIWSASRYGAADLGDLARELKTVNEALWDIEDKIRLKEAISAFDAEFIELARAVYLTNDRRAALKRSVNVLLDSPLLEEKSYADYTTPLTKTGPH